MLALLRRRARPPSAAWRPHAARSPVRRPCRRHSSTYGGGGGGGSSSYGAFSPSSAGEKTPLVLWVGAAYTGASLAVSAYWLCARDHAEPIRRCETAAWGARAQCVVVAPSPPSSSSLPSSSSRRRRVSVPPPRPHAAARGGARASAKDDGASDCAPRRARARTPDGYRSIPRSSVAPTLSSRAATRLVREDSSFFFSNDAILLRLERRVVFFPNTNQVRRPRGADRHGGAQRRGSRRR